MKREDTTSPVVFVITGPTASGKSSLSYHIQKQLSCRIISADSRQVYREMSIGTAKPSREEIDSFRIRLCDFISVNDPYTAADFARDGSLILEEDFLEHNYSIVCGGTGMYIRALTYGLDRMPRLDPEVKRKWDKLARDAGLSYLQEKIKEWDPDYAAKVDLHNSRRLVRALALIDQTGKPFSSFLTGKPKDRVFDIAEIILERPRKELRRRIEQRVDFMMDAGLLAEVERLITVRHLKALDTVGYRELFEYLDGKLSLDEAVERIKIHSRQYAKRQMTWLKKYHSGPRFHPEDIKTISAYVQARIKS